MTGVHPRRAVRLRLGCGRDILVKAEEVLGIKLRLRLSQAIIVSAIVAGYTILIVTGHEIHITTLLRIGTESVVITAHPFGVCFKVSRVFPSPRDNHCE